jgi:hypothetical protein
MAELCDGRMVEPYPDAAVWRPFRFNSDRAEGKVAARVAKASGVIVILTIRPIWEQAAPVASVRPVQCQGRGRAVARWAPIEDRRPGGCRPLRCKISRIRLKETPRRKRRSTLGDARAPVCGLNDAMRDASRT